MRTATHILTVTIPAVAYFAAALTVTNPTGGLVIAAGAFPFGALLYWFYLRLEARDY